VVCDDDDNSGGTPGWTDDGTVVRLTTATDNVAMATTSADVRSVLTISATSTISNTSNLLTLKIPTSQGGISYSGTPFSVQGFSSSTLFTIDRFGGLIASASSTIAANLHVSGIFQASSTVWFGGGRVDYSVRSTSTIPNSQPYAWTVATSTIAEPIWRIDTSYSLAGSGKATSSIRGGLTLDSGAFEYDYGSGVTSADSLQIGPMAFDTDAGILSWINLPVATSTQDDVHSYTAQLDDEPMLTIYGRTGGSGALRNTGVAIGTTTPYAKLSVWAGTTTPIGRTAFSVISSASSTLFQILDNGRTGIGTTSSASLLAVHGGALISGTTTVQGLIATSTIYTSFPGLASLNGVCHSGGVLDAAAVGDLRQLVVCSAGPSDIAEWYETATGTEEGDIVMPTQRMITYVSETVDARTGMLGGAATHTIAVLARATNSRTMLGVVSTDPYQTFGRAIIKYATNPQPVSLIGCVPVKVNGEGGAIVPGDRIALSSVPGVGSKATTSGMTVGVALESFSGGADEIGLIHVFVNLAFGRIDESGDFVAAASATSGTDSGASGLSSADIDRALSRAAPSGGIIGEGFSWVLDQFEKLGIVFREGIVKATAFVADKVIARKAVLDALELRDSATGDTYCVRITSGEITKFRGTCGETPESISLEPAALAPAEVFVPEPPPVSAPEPASDPDATLFEPAATADTPTTTPTEAAPIETATETGTPAATPAAPAETATSSESAVLESPETSPIEFERAASSSAPSDPTVAEPAAVSDTTTTESATTTP